MVLCTHLSTDGKIVGYALMGQALQGLLGSVINFFSTAAMVNTRGVSTDEPGTYVIENERAALVVFISAFALQIATLLLFRRMATIPSVEERIKHWIDTDLPSHAAALEGTDKRAMHKLIQVQKKIIPWSISMVSIFSLKFSLRSSNALFSTMESPRVDTLAMSFSEFQEADSSGLGTFSMGESFDSFTSTPRALYSGVFEDRGPSPEPDANLQPPGTNLLGKMVPFQCNLHPDDLGGAFDSCSTVQIQKTNMANFIGMQSLAHLKRLHKPPRQNSNQAPELASSTNVLQSASTSLPKASIPKQLLPSHSHPMYMTSPHATMPMATGMSQSMALHNQNALGNIGLRGIRSTPGFAMFVDPHVTKKESVAEAATLPWNLTPAMAATSIQSPEFSPPTSPPSSSLKRRGRTSISRMPRKAQSTPLFERGPQNMKEISSMPTTPRGLPPKGLRKLASNKRIATSYSNSGALQTLQSEPSTPLHLRARGSATALHEANALHSVAPKSVPAVPRRPVALSFVNYGIEDAEELCSAVAPSGSYKSALRTLRATEDANPNDDECNSAQALRHTASLDATTLTPPLPPAAEIKRRETIAVLREHASMHAE
ncbi:hypothetical protein MVES_002819 [Malassezia vespertilionis]|uniref:Uncharacterized protein n=1 Tax=Malassezia vespertilionis TaxID=2020962 RepID=A0A2N1J8T7_9BASI|nr:hypothetical protein MVES_002819 [Malassezia vespertilionis]